MYDSNLSASMELIVPPAISMVTAEGDILNYDYASSLTFTIEGVRAIQWSCEWDKSSDADDERWNKVEYFRIHLLTFNLDEHKWR